MLFTHPGQQTRDYSKQGREKAKGLRRLCDSGGTNSICTEERDNCLLHQQNTKPANWKHSGTRKSCGGRLEEVSGTCLSPPLLFPVYFMQAKLPWMPIASSNRFPALVMHSTGLVPSQTPRSTRKPALFVWNCMEMTKCTSVALKECCQYLLGDVRSCQTSAWKGYTEPVMINITSQKCNE